MEVKRGSVGLKYLGCLKLCPPCNPHLVTTACDTVLKSKPFLSVSCPLSFICVRCSDRQLSSSPPLSFPTSLLCCSETVPASLWRLSLDCKGLGRVWLLPGWLQTRHYLFCKTPLVCLCVHSILRILLVSILVTGCELTEWCNPKV